MEAVLSIRAPAVVAAVAMSVTGCAWIQRSSVSSAPASIEGNQASDRPSLSQTGRFVAFESLGGNLVAGDTNGASDVFIRDHVRETTERVSVASNGSQGNGASRNPSISDDGRFVAFETDASNLFTDDGNSKSDIVVRDRQLGTTTRVSIDALGQPFANDATAPVISGDGTVVAFNVLTPFMSFCCVTVGPYVRVLAAGTTKLMPTAPGQFNLNGQVSLSDDGRRVVYGQLAPVGDDATFGIVVADTTTATLVTGVTSGTLTHQSQGSFDQAISGDGRTVVVTLAAPGVGSGDVYTFDVDRRNLVRILGGLFIRPALADDGSVIALRALDATGYFVTAPPGTPPRVVSASTLAVPASSVGGTDLSGDGAFVAFGSRDPLLIGGDANGVTDVFTRAVGSSHGP